MSESTSRKVLILGLDGATWDVLDTLADDGTMPYLKSLIERGARARLVTVVPPVTATSWTSFVTGLNPGKHGVFEFLLRRKRLTEEARSKRNPFGEVPVNSTLRDGLPIWTLASKAGLRSIVIGVPITYPPEKIAGCMISGFLTPAGRRDFTHPPQLLDEIEREIGSYLLYHREVYSKRGVGRVIGELFRVLDFNIKVTRYLLQRYDWNLFISHFWGTDRAQHELWHLLDESHPRYDPGEAARYAPKLKDFYSSLDDGLKEIIGDADGANVIIASDHGFGPIHTYLSFNVWLMENGYLVLKRDAATLLKRFLYSVGITPVRIYRLSMALGLARLRLSGGFHSRQKMQMLLNRFFLSLGNVDWERTKAYSRGNYGQIYVNLKGREPWGCVSPGVEYQKVRDSIRKDLLSIRDPSGEPLIDQVYFREEIYSGPYVEEAPDIVFLPRDMRYKALGTLDFTSNRFMEPVYGNSGDHRMDGIFLGVGEAFHRGKELEPISILDLAPTILYLLGVPVPKAMDGCILEAAIREDYLVHNKPQYADISLLGNALGSPLTPEESEEIRRRLEGIGYVG